MTRRKPTVGPGYTPIRRGPPKIEYTGDAEALDCTCCGSQRRLYRLEFPYVQGSIGLSLCASCLQELSDKIWLARATRSRDERATRGITVRYNIGGGPERTAGFYGPDIRTQIDAWHEAMSRQHGAAFVMAPIDWEA